MIIIVIIEGEYITMELINAVELVDGDTEDSRTFVSVPILVHHIVYN